VRNIQSQPQVKVRVGDAEFNAIARVVHNDREPQLAATVKALFDAKYSWSDGLIVELARVGFGAQTTAKAQALKTGPHRQAGRVVSSARTVGDIHLNVCGASTNLLSINFGGKPVRRSASLRMAK
jgi:hypothetical protein